MRRILQERGRLRADEPLALGAWFSAEAARALLIDPDGPKRLRDRLATLGLEVVALNGFPAGHFHAARVKHAVYEPSWASAERLLHTEALVRILAKIDGAVTKHRIHKGSMLQDVLAGRPTENEHINGALVRAAEQAGLPAPVNRTLVHLMRLVQEAYG